MKNVMRDIVNNNLFSHLSFYVLPLLFLLLFSSCSNAQSDKILHRNEFMEVNVYQSDLDKYIRDKQIKDTIGKSTYFVTILSNAKARMRFMEMNASSLPKKPYEEVLKEAEEFIRLKNLVNKVLVVKHERKLYLLKDGKTVKSFPIALGPNPVGQKEYEGDGKTPEGTYTLDWQRWNTPVFHSFHISYPNQVDSIRAKAKGLTPGSNIMVHGTSKGIKKKKDWTNGCIGLSNTDMIEFRKIVFQDTPIEIRK